MKTNSICQHHAANCARLIRLNAAIMLLFAFALNIGAETWRFSADEVTSVQKENSSKTVLDGKAQMESERMAIIASHLEMEGADYNRISGEGAVSLTDKERGITVTSGRFFYDRSTKIVGFREMVRLVDEKEGIIIRCESLDLYEEEELLILRIAVRLIQDDTICRGESATYWRDDDILEITGQPVVWRKGDEYRADRIRVNLDSDEITLAGAVAGAFTTESDESE